jgi:16S rRNA (guanine966-N2)-methyltransferase
MRVVAGEARGRSLVAPPGVDTRPTTDRVRESIFNALRSIDAIDAATVLDLFAGSGALGIEALSRGAAHCTFVDTSPQAIKTIQANLASTRLADRARVVHADAFAFLAGTEGQFDLALLDPPYAFERWDALLAKLPAELAVIESGDEVDLPEDWGVVRIRRYGGTVVAFARRANGGRDK